MTLLKLLHAIYLYDKSKTNVHYLILKILTQFKLDKELFNQILNFANKNNLPTKTNSEGFLHKFIWREKS